MLKCLKKCLFCNIYTLEDICIRKLTECQKNNYYAYRFLLRSGQSKLLQAMVLNFCAENGIFSYRSNKTLNLTTDTKVCTWSYGLPLAPNLEHGFTFHSTYKAEFVRLQHPRRQPNCLLLGLSSTRIAIKF